MNVLPIKRDVNPSVVDACRQILKAAESGELVAVVAVGVKVGDELLEYWGQNQPGMMLRLAGAAACLERRIQDHIRDVEEDT